IVSNHTIQPVVYGNGRLIFSEDVLGVRFGITGNLRQELNYINVSNESGIFSGIHGNYNIDPHAPYLLFENNKDIKVVFGAGSTYSFSHETSGSYAHTTGVASASLSLNSTAHT